MVRKKTITFLVNFEWKKEWLAGIGWLRTKPRERAATSAGQSTGLWSQFLRSIALCPQESHVRSPSLKFLLSETYFGLGCPLGILQVHVALPARVQMVLRTKVRPCAAFAELLPSTGFPTLFSAWAS